MGGGVSSSVPEVLLTLNESHQSDGFLWPEALAEISFLPHSLPTQIASSQAEEGLWKDGAVEPKAIQKQSFMTRRGLAFVSVCVVLAFVEHGDDEVQGILGQRKIDGFLEPQGVCHPPLLIRTVF